MADSGYRVPFTPTSEIVQRLQSRPRDPASAMRARQAWTLQPVLPLLSIVCQKGRGRNQRAVRTDCERCEKRGLLT